MPLNNATIANAPTISITGGTPVTLTSDGQQVTNGVHLIDASVTDYRTRPNLTCKSKNPTLKSDGTYGKAKKSISIVCPKVLASGVQEFPTIRIELSDHPEMTQAEVDKLKAWACQVINDADFTSFWYTGSLA